MSGAYKFELPGHATSFEADRFRRERHELVGELTVRCALEGTKAIDGVLSIADFNFSSARARQDRAKLLKERARTNGELDWLGFLEEFCQRVIQSEREGDPAVDLRTLVRPPPDDNLRVDGIVFPRRHPTMIFGDGGGGKSYILLHILGRLAQLGLKVALFDWELSGGDHRDRLERLFGSHMPQVFYCRCERPLTSEADRLRRIVRENSIDYAGFDSVAFACDGRPEDAEIAGRYFRAVREIGCGSLHVAHVNKSEENDKKPFGSSFWHNGSRSTWYVQAAEQTGDDSTLRLGLFNRKSNLGPLLPATSYAVSFTGNRTLFNLIDVADTPDLADKLSVKQRMCGLLRGGSRTVEDLAEAIEAKPETIERTARRYRSTFICLGGGRIALVQS